MIEGTTKLQLEETKIPAPEDLKAIVDGLEAYNDLHRTVEEQRHLALILRNDSGIVQGGLLGYMRWHWLHIEVVWIAEEYRRSGYGSQLITRAEEIARVNGCRRSRLDTAEFQARPFYEKLGYSLFGTLDDYPPGSRIYYLQKDLTVGDETA